VLVMPAGPSADEFATYCLVALLASNAARVLGPEVVALMAFGGSYEAPALAHQSEPGGVTGS
jgi:hypothetical protein